MKTKPSLGPHTSDIPGGIAIRRRWKHLFASHVLSLESESSSNVESSKKAQLGKYAQEKQMPSWLMNLLREKGQVITSDIIPVIEQLLERNRSTQYAYLCHPDTYHVSKLRREGAFCGYRTIQMLISYFIGTHTTNWKHFADSMPSIFQLQQMIEDGWDQGYNPHGRFETGGIKGTRKYIGTLEAQTLFQSLGFSCSVRAFREDAASGTAVERLMNAVETYFQKSSYSCPNGKVRSTSLPPIYLQMSGHSLAVIGFERQIDDQCLLLVLDPAFQGSRVVKQLSGQAATTRVSITDTILRPYRRSTVSLRKHDEFEMLCLTTSL